MKLEDYLKTIDLDEIDRDAKARKEKYSKQWEESLKESSLNRVRKAWTEHDVGCITAFRSAENCGEGAVIVKKEKMARNSELRKILLAKGYGVTPIKGSWFENGDIEKNEASFFVVDHKDKGTLKRDIVKLGIKYEQDSIVFAKAGSDFYGISTNKCLKSQPGYGKLNVEEKFGMPKFGKTGIYGFSRVNGRAFVFEGYHMTVLRDHGVAEWRSIMAVHDEAMGSPSIFKKE